MTRKEQRILLALSMLLLSISLLIGSLAWVFFSKLQNIETGIQKISISEKTRLLYENEGNENLKQKPEILSKVMPLILIERLQVKVKQRIK